jgi:DNA polymerase-4
MSTDARQSMRPRVILHVDMDAFYASVEERDRPELRGKPVIVGGSSGRGVVAAANYAVRRYGVHSAMPVAVARRLCPEAVCIPPRMSRYREVSAEVFEIFREFTPLVEGLSLDEAFLDLTGSERLLGEPERIGHDIKQRIRERTGLGASVGIAPNKLLAKIASDLHKPDGLCRIGADNLHDILDPLPIARLFGVGQKSLPAVHAAGILSFGDLRKAGDEAVWRAFGSHGTAMRRLAAGVDERPVTPDRDEKSISAEETFAQDIRDAGRLRAELLHLADRTASRLRARCLAAALVIVKIRRADFRTYTRQRALGCPTQDTGILAGAAGSLLDDWLCEHAGAAVRLLGVGVGDLRTLQQAQQTDLFAAGPPRGSQLDAAVDDIRRRFGSGLVTRASQLKIAPGSRGPQRGGA